MNSHSCNIRLPSCILYCFTLHIAYLIILSGFALGTPLASLEITSSTDRRVHLHDNGPVQNITDTDEDITCVDPTNPNWENRNHFQAEGLVDCAMLCDRFEREGPSSDQNIRYIFHGNTTSPPPKSPYRFWEVPWGIRFRSCSLVLAMRNQWPKDLIPSDEHAHELPDVAHASFRAVNKQLQVLFSDCLIRMPGPIEPGWTSVGKNCPHPRHY